MRLRSDSTARARRLRITNTFLEGRPHVPDDLLEPAQISGGKPSARRPGDSRAPRGPPAARRSPWSPPVETAPRIPRASNPAERARAIALPVRRSQPKPSPLPFLNSQPMVISRQSNRKVSVRDCGSVSGAARLEFARANFPDKEPLEFIVENRQTSLARTRTSPPIRQAPDESTQPARGRIAAGR